MRASRLISFIVTGAALGAAAWRLFRDEPPDPWRGR
jgi:hypothetical protein